MIMIVTICRMMFFSYHVAVHKKWPNDKTLWRFRSLRQTLGWYGSVSAATNRRIKFPSMFWECSPGSKFQSLVVLRHFATHHFLVPDWCLHAKERPLFEYNILSVWVWGIAILGYPCRWESCYCQELKTDGRRNHSRWGLATPFVSPEFGGTPFWGQKLVVAL